mgnify:FL=1|jgi:hypothetical protein
MNIHIETVGEKYEHVENAYIGCLLIRYTLLHQRSIKTKP